MTHFGITRTYTNEFGNNHKLNYNSDGNVITHWHNGVLVTSTPLPNVKHARGLWADLQRMIIELGYSY